MQDSDAPIIETVELLRMARDGVADATTALESKIRHLVASKLPPGSVTRVDPGVITDDVAEALGNKVTVALIKGTCTPPVRLEAYVGKAAKRVLADLARRRNRLTRLPQTQAPADSAQPDRQTEYAKVLLYMEERLSREDWDWFLQHYGAGKSYVLIAKEQGNSMEKRDSTVRRIQRTLHALKEHLETERTNTTP